MASFRRPKAKGKPWTYRFIDEHGKQVERTGHPDKKTTEAMAREAETLVARVKAGLYERPKVPLECLDGFLASMRAKDRDPKHVTQTELYCRRILAACPSMDEDGVLKALADLKLQGFSNRTVNAHQTAIKSLAYYMRKPLLGLRGHKRNEKIDRRRIPRALTADEARRLLDVTRRAGPSHGISGEDRYTLYLVGLATGLRRSELASLTTGSFRVEGSPALVVCEPSYTKNSDDATQPVPDNVADHLRRWLPGRPEGVPIFGMRSTRSGEMLRRDLVAAEIDPASITMHTLRHTYITALIRSGASLAVVKQLARHSKVELTLAVYTHLTMEDEKVAVDGISSLFHPYGGKETSPSVSTGVIENEQAGDRKSFKMDKLVHERPAGTAEGISMSRPIQSQGAYR